MWISATATLPGRPIPHPVHARQRRDRPVLHARDHGRRRGALRLRRRRRPRRRSCRRARDGSRLVRNDLSVCAGRRADAPLHRCHRSRRHRPCAATAWAPRSATTTTTAISISSSPSFGADTLYRNNGDGTFTDVTREAGVSDPLWSTSAAFLDYDRDGDLDLFVANYLDFTIADNKICHDPVGARDYCSPRAYRPVPDRLYRNDGRGRFVDVTEPAGIARADGNGLGVVGRRLQRRRLARSLRRQRRDAEPVVDQPPRRHVRGRGRALGRGVERGRQPRRQHGHRVRRLRRRRRRRPVRHQHHRRDVRALRERRQGQLRRCARAGRAWRGRRRPSRASAPTGSTTTTTAGSISSSPTAPSTSSNRSADSRRRIA